MAIQSDRTEFSVSKAEAETRAQISEAKSPAMILLGHNIDEMRKLPAGSVQLCVTSPPYYGLRDYKIAATIWGGKDDCEHEWGECENHSEREVATVAGKSRTSDRSWGDDPTRKFNGNHQRHSAGAFCRKCGAWLGNLGLEPDPELYVRNMGLVFAEVHRILRDDGTLWINLGDSSAGSRSGEKRQVPHMDGRDFDRYLENGRIRVQDAREIPIKGRRSKRITCGAGRWGGGNVPATGALKPKDLIGIPWMVAFALRSDGWYLRSRIPWIKRNPMPESADDRPTVAIEEFFLLAKSERYFYDGHAVKMPASLSSHRRMAQNVEAQRGSSRANGGGDARPMRAGGRSPGVNPKAVVPDGLTKQNTSFSAAVVDLVSTRSRRNSDWFLESWQGLLTDDEGEPLALIVNTAPYKEAHFATFPMRLVKPIILAGTSERGACVECGAPWRRLVEKGEPDLEHQRACGSNGAGEYNGEATKDFEAHRAQDASATKARILEGMRKSETVGWHPTCDCVAGNPKSQAPRSKYFVRSVTNRRIERCNRASTSTSKSKRRAWYRKEWQRRIDAHFPGTRPCVVLDPFGGSGTTAAMALELGREPISIDISAEYTGLSKKRVNRITPALALFD